GLSETEAARGFLASAEFQSRHASDATYLDALYRAALGRDPDPAGKAAFGELLRQGVSRDEVARRVLTSAGAARRAVDAAYATFLGRRPDAAGAAHWLRLLEGEGPLSAAQFAQAFLVSGEFFTRAEADPYLVPRGGSLVPCRRTGHGVGSAFPEQGPPPAGPDSKKKEKTSDLVSDSGGAKGIVSVWFVARASA